jgi:hypothetical protein
MRPLLFVGPWLVYAVVNLRSHSCDAPLSPSLTQKGPVAKIKRDHSVKLRMERGQPPRSVLAELGHSQMRNRPLTKKSPARWRSKGRASQSGSSGVLGGTPKPEPTTGFAGELSPGLKFNVWCRSEHADVSGSGGLPTHIRSVLGRPPAHTPSDGLSLPPMLGPFLFWRQGAGTHLLKPRAIWHCLMPSANCVVPARPGHNRLTADI